MKYVIIFLLSISSVYAQDAKTDTIDYKPRAYNEISGKLLSSGYSRLWNIHDKMILGAGFNIGYTIYLGPVIYSDFILIKVYTRDIFRKNKSLATNEKYDIGIYGSFSNLYQVFFYGIISSYYFKLSNRLKLGIDLHIGEFNNDDHEHGLYFSFSPIIIYKFN